MTQEQGDPCPGRARWTAVLALVVALGRCPSARGQGPEPSLPAAPAHRGATIEERLRALEEANRNLAAENRRLSRQLGDMSAQYGKVAEQFQALSQRLDVSLVRTRQEP